MMRLRQILFLLLSFCVLSNRLAAAELPLVLKDWQDWVMKGEEKRLCPLREGMDGSALDQFDCAFIGPLTLTRAGEKDWRFAFSAVLHRAGFVVLPGSSTQWPRLSGSSAVVEREGQPQVYLQAGTHKLEGSVMADGSLPVANGSALIVEGAKSFFGRIEGGVLSFADDGTEVASEGEEGFLKVEAYRRINDGLPMTEDLQIHIEAAGTRAAVNFGKVNLAGFQFLKMDSDLPATLNRQGELEVQVLPGSHVIHLFGRGLALEAVKGPEAPSEAWPGDEVWAFQQQNELRTVSLEGLAPVDPTTVTWPEEWGQLPSFLFKKSEALTLTERSRGQPEQDAQLTLSRRAWLDFSGKKITVEDRLQGRVFSQSRLDLKAPLQLQFASVGGQAQVISAGKEEGTRGLELRQSDFSLQAVSEAPFTRTLPASGWSRELKEETFRLILPPGFFCLHAQGAESSDGTWTGSWNLWRLFILCFIFALIFKLHGWVKLLIAMPPLLWFYPSDPWLAYFLTLVLLAQFALRLSKENLQARLKPFAALLSFLFILVLLPFVATEIRYILHPQLQNYWIAPSYEETMASVSSNVKTMALEGAADYAMDRAEEAAAPQAESALESVPPPPGLAPAAPAAPSAKYRTTQAEIPAVSIAAGPGIPAWNGASVNLTWKGPVDADKQVFFLILNRWQKALMTISCLGLLFALLFHIFRSMDLRAPLHSLRRLWPVLLCAFVLSAGEKVWAADYPSPELLKEMRERLIKAPECAPQCLTISEAGFYLKGQELQVVLQLNALHASSFPLPTATGADLFAIQLNERESGVAFVGEADYSFVPAGRSKLILKWMLRKNAARLSFSFPQRVMRFDFDLGSWRLESRDAQLSAGKIEIVRGEKGGESEAAVTHFGALASVSRTLYFAEKWRVQTLVQRITEGEIKLELDAIPGESLTAGPQVSLKDGKISVRLDKNDPSLEFSSLLPVNPGEIQLTHNMPDHSLSWTLESSALWRLEAEGTPLISSDLSRQTYQPRAGENLKLTLARPQFAEGAALAFDGVDLKFTQGEQQMEGTASLNYRVTRRLDQVVQLPADWRVKELTIDNVNYPVPSGQRELSLSLRPPSGQVAIKFSTQRPLASYLHIDLPDFRAMVANVNVQLNASRSRWILFTSGGLVAPVVLYWNALVIFALLALVLSRAGFSILKYWQWLLLGWGLASVSWSVLILFAIWMGLLQVRHKRSEPLSRFLRLEQFFYVFLSLIVVVSLIGSVASGLLSEPDMAVVGNGSYGQTLRWFYDLYDGRQKPFVLSLPIWIYKVTMLLWAIWLAFSILEWIRYAWAGISKFPITLKKPANQQQNPEG